MGREGIVPDPNAGEEGEAEGCGTRLPRPHEDGYEAPPHLPYERELGSVRRAVNGSGGRGMGSGRKVVTAIFTAEGGPYSFCPFSQLVGRWC